MVNSPDHGQDPMPGKYRLEKTISMSDRGGILKGEKTLRVKGIGFKYKTTQTMSANFNL